MAKGITESDVHTAADALVASGERPTVERIRAHLGTGSPNTVTRWLDSWWRQLGARLAAQQAKLALPAAPEPVVVLATQWWELALSAARVESEQALVEERTRLEAQRRELAEREQAWQAQIHQHAAMGEQARRLLATAEQRLADVQRTCDAQALQLHDLEAQRDAANLRVARLDGEFALAQQHAQAREVAWTAERDEQARHLRALEDRAHTEIDRARQEVKELRRQIETQRAAATEEARRLQQRAEQATAAAAEAQRDAAGERARAQALERQAAKLADLPVALEKALARVRTKAPIATKPRGAKGTRAPS